MAIASDWDIDYICKQISHIDGTLDWDCGTGTVPVADDYVYKVADDAVAKTLVTLTGTSGTADTFTNTVGRFTDGVGLIRLPYVDFDTVTNCGFSVGDTIIGATSCRTGVIRAIEYNNIVATPGQGRVYGCFTGGACNEFDVCEALQVSASTKALAVGVGSGLFDWAASVNEATSGTLNPNGANNTSQLFNFDNCGTQVFIPDGAQISDTICSTKTATVQEHIGATDASKGTLRAVDITGCWANNDPIFIQCVVKYDTLVAGQVFSAGDVVKGATSLAESRILSVVTCGCTGTIITAGIVSGPYCGTEALQVSGTTIASLVCGSTDNVDSFTDVLGAPRTRQRDDLQGGIYDDCVSLNVVRSVNALYTHIQDTFDELGQLDDPVPMSAQVKDQQYTLINNWQIPDLSMRFLESGSIQDCAKNNIFTNYQTLGSIQGVGDQGYIEDATTPAPQPQLYVEQNGTVLREDWLEGNVNILVKVKTSTDTTIICGTVCALGQLVDTGTVTIFNRKFGHTYDLFETTTVGGTAPMPLATALDADNTTSQYTNTYTGCGGFTVGEEVTVATSLAIATVVADCVTCNFLTYDLQSGSQFGNSELITGAVSAATATSSACGSTGVVAAYCAQVRQMTVEVKVATGGGTGTTGTFRPGETLTQAVTGATGFILTVDDVDAIYLEKTNVCVFSGDNVITGGISGATYDPGCAGTYTANQLVVPGDLGEGSGEECYTAYIVGNHNAAACASPIIEIYEWTKFELRKESVLPIAGKGNATTDIEGNIYRLICSAYAEVKVAPFGSFAGGSMFGARGIFICNESLSLLPADIQKVQLINNCGVTRNPPNIQCLTVTAVLACDSVAVYRAINACACYCTILTTQFTVSLAACENEAADTSIVVTAGTCALVCCALAQDIPCAGVLRVNDPNNCGIFLRFPYNAICRTAERFTLTSGTIGTVTACTALTNCDDVFVVYIEESVAACQTSASNSVIYVADRPLIIRVRRKGILPFETEATFTSTGSSVGAVRTTDPVVDLP